MLRAIGLRYLILATLIFSVGVVDIAMAATSPSTHQLHRQDLGDDDGDGIPNYLDPDDNNDGVLDSDTPAPTPTPLPPTPVPTSPPSELTPTPVTAPEDDSQEIPAPESPNEDSDTDETVSIPEESVTPDQPVESAPPVASEPVAQVNALPNTGSGSHSFGLIGSTVLLLMVLTTFFAVINLKRKHRMS